METEMTERIYPRLDASAPPEHFVNNSATDYRLNYVNSIKDEIKKTCEQKKSLTKRYKNMSSSCDYANYSLNVVSATSGAVGITILSTVVLSPVSIILAGVSAGCGVSSIIVSKLNKKFKKKTHKHHQIVNLCNSKLNTIESILSKAFEDGHITDKEFNLILNEFKHYNSSLQEIRKQKHTIDFDNLKTEIKQKIDSAFNT